MHATLQDVFREHFAEFERGRSLHPRERRAAWCISRCRQPEMGGHVLSCPQGHYATFVGHACGHRSCPRCASGPRQLWLAQQLPKLLPCPHFHAVFTLPHAFIALWQFNRTLLTQMLFDSARASLLELCADARHLGAIPGLLMALHTWGRTLSHHPHIHCLVSAGGADAQGQWRACKSSFLVPVEPLRQLFRGKLLSAISQALNHQRLALPPQQPAPHWRTAISQQWRAHWNIQLNPAYPHGRGVALYLARYVKGGPLGSDRRLHLSDDAVAFAYFDHHDAKRKNLTLPVAEFIARILWHAPPKGQHTVRHAGLYATTHRRHYLACLRQLTPQPDPPVPQPLASHQLDSKPAATPPVCPQCFAPLLRSSLPPKTHQTGEFSLHPQSPPATPSAPGPTRRCNGHLTAGRTRSPPYLGPSAAGC